MDLLLSNAHTTPVPLALSNSHPLCRQSVASISPCFCQTSFVREVFAYELWFGHGCLSKVLDHWRVFAGCNQDSPYATGVIVLADKPNNRDYALANPSRCTSGVGSGIRSLNNTVACLWSGGLKQITRGRPGSVCVFFVMASSLA